MATTQFDDYEDLTPDQFQQQAPRPRSDLISLRRAARQALIAWDSTPLSKGSDGMLQECMEELRDALTIR